ncbi:MAG: AbrB/MazE/SpoVT family DNA-binding domain-containing protein [Firmicutes bacterium]|nr:AbrB/MazE/SpoVT family DNA-binding domain-containing protein [Bacillota bacterium]
MLKSTGVIRKIDELGRIVIPKEIRKVLNIESGDDLEIYVDNQQLILEKYSVMHNLKNDTNKIIESVTDLIDATIIISDKEMIITRGKYENFILPPYLKDLLYERKGYVSTTKDCFSFSGNEINAYFIIEPIIQNSDANGLVIIFKNTSITKEDIFLVKVLKNIIENK